LKRGGEASAAGLRIPIRGTSAGDYALAASGAMIMLNANATRSLLVVSHIGISSSND
jgi:hypothetical protein